MRKIVSLLLLVSLAPALLTGCAASAEQRTATAQGYGGPLRVSVTLNGNDITRVEVLSHAETQGVGTRAIDVLPERIVSADSTDVEGVTGATITSNAIRSAVAMAMSGTGMPDASAPAPAEDETPLTGVGMVASGRLGPGTEEDGTPVRSFNVVFAAASFDGEGRIQTLEVDQLEVLSSEFAGFPADEADDARFLEQVAAWRTKGAKGDAYRMASGSWRQQMDAYAAMMQGKTVDEVETWFSTHFSPETGKPLDSGPQGAPADAVTGPSMSLRDEHGDIITAIRLAWEDAQTNGRAGTGMEGATPAEDVPPSEGVPPAEGVITDTNINHDSTDGASARAGSLPDTAG